MPPPGADALAENNATSVAIMIKSVRAIPCAQAD